MADFLVSPPAGTDWRVEVEEFERLVRGMSRGPQIWRSGDPHSLAALRFNVAFTDEHQLDGWLMRDGQVVELSGGLEESAMIATWIRTIVPTEQELIFWDEGYHFVVSLIPGMNHHQVMDAIPSWT